MSRLFAVPLVLLLTSLPLTASAQSGTPDTENGRYSFSRVEDGHLRLDQRTGQFPSAPAAIWAGRAIPSRMSGQRSRRRSRVCNGTMRC